MAKTILMKLYGPLQSWGTSSKFNYRETDLAPSKSAIIGIIAASFGYKRDDDRINRFNSLEYGVRIDKQGSLLCDFQIVKENKIFKESRLFDHGEGVKSHLVYRYYLEDAKFLVAIRGEDEEISKIYQALKNPVFQPFMGRKSCPLPADFLIGILDDDVIDTLSFYPPLVKTKKEESKIPCFVDYKIVKNTDQKPIFRLDKIESFKLKKYQPRAEAKIWV